MFVVTEVDVPDGMVKVFVVVVIIVTTFVGAQVIVLVIKNEQGLWNPVKSLGAIWIETIASFQVPKTIVASALGVVEVSVRVIGRQPVRTEVAEVSVTLEAAHMVTAHPLLTGHIARRARGRV